MTGRYSPNRLAGVDQRVIRESLRDAAETLRVHASRVEDTAKVYRWLADEAERIANHMPTRVHTPSCDSHKGAGVSCNCWCSE